MNYRDPLHFKGMTSTLRSLPRPSGIDPLGFSELTSLQTLRRLLARGGLPPQPRRSPADDARIAAFFTLQELLHILTEFRRAHLRGAHCRLVVSENGRSPGRITLEIAIVPEGRNDVAA